MFLSANRTCHIWTAPCSSEPSREVFQAVAQWAKRRFVETPVRCDRRRRWVLDSSRAFGQCHYPAAVEQPNEAGLIVDPRSGFAAMLERIKGNGANGAVVDCRERGADAMLVNSIMYFNRLRKSVSRYSLYVFSAHIGSLVPVVPAILQFTNSLLKFRLRPDVGLEPEVGGTRAGTCAGCARYGSA